MKKILYLLLFLPFSAYSQEVENGTIFTIEFPNLKENMDFNVIEKKSYQGILDDLKIDSIFLKNKPAENQIIAAFGKGKFGNSVSMILVLKSGLNDNLNYNLEIKVPQNGKFEKTSVSPLFKNVKSTEYWPYDIEKINFFGFKAIPIENLKTLRIEEKIDSACIKHADETIALGEQQFKSFFKSIVLQFEGNDMFKIDKSLEYEKSINSENVSLDHFWSIGEDIYPNKKRYKFGNPLSFRRIECPYFDETVDYFYTKAKRDIKVVDFDWKTFEESNIRANKAAEKDGHLKFIEKYDFLVGALSEILGKPLTIEQENNSGRIDTKWRLTNGINAYLFRVTNYDEIRLFIYKD